jgi:hypothetical protein
VLITGFGRDVPVCGVFGKASGLVDAGLHVGAGGVAHVEGVDLGWHEARIGGAVVVHDEVDVGHGELRRLEFGPEQRAGRVTDRQVGTEARLGAPTDDVDAIAISPFQTKPVAAIVLG